MSSLRNVSVLYFTDILCVWAYIAQIRMDQLKSKFAEQIVVEEHFVSVFGSVAHNQPRRSAFYPDQNSNISMFIRMLGLKILLPHQEVVIYF